MITGLRAARVEPELETLLASFSGQRQHQRLLELDGDTAVVVDPARSVNAQVARELERSADQELADVRIDLHHEGRDGRLVTAVVAPGEQFEEQHHLVLRLRPPWSAEPHVFTHGVGGEDLDVGHAVDGRVARAVGARRDHRADGGLVGLGVDVDGRRLAGRLAALLDQHDGAHHERDGRDDVARTGVDDETIPHDGDLRSCLGAWVSRAQTPTDSRAFAAGTCIESGQKQ